MTIQDQIKSRAEQEYKIFHDIDQHLDADINLIEYKDDLQDAYQQGAESMIPIMKYVAQRYANWIDFKYETIDREPINEWCEQNDKDLYDYFLEHIYKP
jgi:hypothetical protein